MARVAVGGNTGPITKWESPGQKIEGIFAGVRPGKKFANNPEPSKLVDLKKADGSMITAGAPTALAGRLASVPLGAMVYIEYLGKARGQGGVEYKNFNVEMDVPDGTPGAQAAPPAPQGVAALEQKLRDSKGAQVAELMISALKQKFPAEDVYTKAIRDLLTSHGVA